MNKSVIQYSPEEVETALHILNKAIDNHRLWFDSLHTSILCDLPFAQDILHQAAHTQCDFGKWYYGDVSESITCVKEFSELEPVHKYMHDHARELADKVKNKKSFGVEEYREFLSNQHHLIDLLTKLRDTLIQHEHCYDSVTGAVNRKSISLYIEQLYENYQRYNKFYTLAMVDVDYFKKINDQHGHLTGDQVLKHISIYFRESLRRSDCIGRYGGEEFIILFPETNTAEAHDLMNKSRTGLANKKIIVGDAAIDATVSVGISEVSREDDDAWEAVERADQALYNAKSSGRNCVK